jgi:hypothetical protein
MMNPEKDGMKNTEKKGMEEAAEHSTERSEFADVREKLRDALPPVGQLDIEAELRRDLWPDMLRRLAQSSVRVPWFDWALLAISGAAAIFFPALIPALVYHL